MKTVFTKEELGKALKAKEANILIKGELANTIKTKIQRKKTAKKVGIGTIVIGAAALVAAPFTGGASIAAGIAATGLAIGGVTITAGELAIILGFTLALYGLLKDCNIKYNADGSVELNKK